MPEIGYVFKCYGSHRYDPEMDLLLGEDVTEGTPWLTWRLPWQDRPQNARVFATLILDDRPYLCYEDGEDFHESVQAYIRDAVERMLRGEEYSHSPFMGMLEPPSTDSQLELRMIQLSAYAMLNTSEQEEVAEPDPFEEELLATISTPATA